MTYEDRMLYGLREERIAFDIVDRRLKARQLGEAWIGIERRVADDEEGTKNADR